MNRKVKFLIENFKRFNSNTAKFLNKRYLYAWTSEMFCALFFGSSPDDYFRYRFYEKSNYERNKFVTYKRSKKIIKKNNDKSLAYIFHNKIEFNKRFESVLGREWLNLESATQTEFEDFVKKHKQIMMKPFNGGQGKGIFKLSVDDLNEIGSLDSYRNFIAEELLIQHDVLSSINPTSVNTIRVLTFCGEIVACALRSGGKDAVVDNLHSCGVCAHIDIESGIIDAKAIDMHFNKYTGHPDSHTKLLGLQIPNWEELKSFVKQAANIVPEMKYVGWDIAVLKDGFAVIEGNHDPGHDVVQMIAQTGIYKRIQEIKKDEKNGL